MKQIEFVLFAGYKNITKIFLNHGIDVNLRTEHEQTSLHIAAGKTTEGDF